MRTPLIRFAFLLCCVFSNEAFAQQIRCGFANKPPCPPTGTPSTIIASKSPITSSPSSDPTSSPSRSPTNVPTPMPTHYPSQFHSGTASISPSNSPSMRPTKLPTRMPSRLTTSSPSTRPTNAPNISPSKHPSQEQTRHPHTNPSTPPTKKKTITPSQPNQTNNPANKPTEFPSETPDNITTLFPSFSPTQQRMTANDIGNTDDSNTSQGELDTSLLTAIGVASIVGAGLGVIVFTRVKKRNTRNLLSRSSSSFESSVPASFCASYDKSGNKRPVSVKSSWMSHMAISDIPEELQKPQGIKEEASAEAKNETTYADTNTHVSVELPSMEPSHQLNYPLHIGQSDGRKATSSELKALVKFIRTEEPNRSLADVQDHVHKLVLKYTYANLRRAINVRYGSLPREWRASEKLAKGLTDVKA